MRGQLIIIWIGRITACSLLCTGCTTSLRTRVSAIHREPFPSIRTEESHSANGTAHGESSVERVQAIARIQPPVERDGEANIDLPYALELAGAGNPTIELAREATLEAEAQLQSANALKLPSLNAGFNFRIHRGNLQRSPGSILDVDSQSLYFGFGARSLAAETVAIPGLRFYYPLADVISEPQAARQRVVARRADAVAVQNVTLLEVAAAYIELQQADSILKELKQSESEFDEIVRLTKAYAKSGKGREADANRALANAELLRRQTQEAIGERTAASARLAGLLSLDPTARLVLPSIAAFPLKMIDPNASLESLLAQAEANRPELVARTSEIAEARVRTRQEQIRPWLPTLIAGFSAGGFGGGSNLTTSEFGRFDSRTDFDVMAVWNIQNLGFGNRANVKRNQSVMRQAMNNLDETRNRVRLEVAEARAEILASAAQIETARRKFSIAQEGYDEESKRIQLGAGLPLEIIDSARSLLESRLELVRAITQHNLAQFRLIAAVGTAPGALPIQLK